MSKTKGTSGTRTRNARKTKQEPVEKSNSTEELEFDMAIQRATQIVTDKYEKELFRIKKNQTREMQSFIDGQKIFVKPRFIDRLFGRFKDMYIVFNHMRPWHCKHCGTNYDGANDGIECVTLDIDTALGYIDEIFDKYDKGKARLVHVQVDRRSSRTGQVVDVYNFLMRDWDPEKKQYMTHKLLEESVENRIHASLVEDRKNWRKGQRRNRKDINL